MNFRGKPYIKLVGESDANAGYNNVAEYSRLQNSSLSHFLFRYYKLDNLKFKYFHSVISNLINLNLIFATPCLKVPHSLPASKRECGVFGPGMAKNSICTTRISVCVCGGGASVFSSLHREKKIFTLKERH